MNHEHDAFEHDLRRGLSALAASGPAGPSGDAVLARLHQRTRRRRIAAVSACAAVAVALSLLALQQPASQPVTPPENRARIEPATIPQPELVKSPATPPPSESVASLLNLRQPAEKDPVAIAAAQPVEMDWNLTLSLSLASHVNEESWSSLRFDSPAWR